MLRALLSNVVAAIAALASLAAFATAQDGTREGDTRFTKSELQELLTGQVIEFFDGSKSRFGTDGRYGYTYTDDGPVWAGDYSVGTDSDVCVAFDNGSSRCDRFVESGGRTVLITSDGLRFPIRNRSVSED